MWHSDVLVMSYLAAVPTASVSLSTGLLLAPQVLDMRNEQIQVMQESKEVRCC
jgi:hypothetical protein